MSLFKSIPIDVIKKAKALESVAFALIDDPNYDFSMLEEVISSDKFDFSVKDYKKHTLCQKAIVNGDVELFKFIFNLRKLKTNYSAVSLDDFFAINRKNLNKEILDILIENADKRTIKKFILAGANRAFMNPKGLWVMMKLEAAIVSKGDKKWNFFDDLNDNYNDRDAVLINAIKCKDIHSVWLETVMKSDFIKKAKPVLVNSTTSQVESALGCALLLNDFKLAKRLLDAGYKIDAPGSTGEINICIKMGVGVAGISFLLENGCSPFKQCDISGWPRAITCEKDVLKELKTPSEKMNLLVRVNYDESLLLALKEKQYEIANLLISAGSSLNRVLACVSQEERSLVESFLLKQNNMKGIDAKANGLSSIL